MFGDYNYQFKKVIIIANLSNKIMTDIRLFARIIINHQMSKILLGLILIVSICAGTTQVDAPNPPMWSPSFYVAYEETFVKGNASYTFNGQFFYDAPNKRQRADKVNGRYDATCASILPNVSTKCQHLVVDEKRYIVFPDKNQCCMCCDAEHGCGIMRADWFKDGKYLGQEKIVDTVYDKWVKPEIADAFYWTTTDSNQTPRRFQEDDKTHTIDYLTHTFVNKTFDNTIFALPTFCNSTSICPSSTVCGKFRENAQLLRQ